MPWATTTVGLSPAVMARMRVPSGRSMKLVTPRGSVVMTSAGYGPGRDRMLAACLRAARVAQDSAAGPEHTPDSIGAAGGNAASAGSVDNAEHRQLLFGGD